MHINYQKLERSVLSMRGGTWRMDHWRLFRQRNQCGINFSVCNFYINQDAKLAKAFHNRFCLPYPQLLELVEDIRSNNLFDRWCGYKPIIKRCRRWSCSFLVRFVTSVVGGPSTTVKSPLPAATAFVFIVVVVAVIVAVSDAVAADAFS